MSNPVPIDVLLARLAVEAEVTLLHLREVEKLVKQIQEGR